MKSNLTSIVAVLVAVTLIGSLIATNIQQASAFGFVERQQFKKLTHEFEKGVIAALKHTRSAQCL